MKYSCCLFSGNSYLSLTCRLHQSILCNTGSITGCNRHYRCLCGYLCSSYGSNGGGYGIFLIAIIDYREIYSCRCLCLSSQSIRCFLHPGKEGMAAAGNNACKYITLLPDTVIHPVFGSFYLCYCIAIGLVVSSFQSQTSCYGCNGTALSLSNGKRTLSTSAIAILSLYRHCGRSCIHIIGNRDGILAGIHRTAIQRYYHIRSCRCQCIACIGIGSIDCYCGCA